jgi:protein-L-isoaspartate(D-aspartate) O-methyltransferase
MRYISAPHRSQSAGASGRAVAASVVLTGAILVEKGPYPFFEGSSAEKGAPALFGVGSDMGQIMAWIDEQLVARGIRDARVLDAMGRVPREVFVPGGVVSDAHADRALSIGGGQTISQPYMVAVMTEALRLTGTERVLDVGTGSGYQAAILAELAREVITIERIPELAGAARTRLAALGYANVVVLVGDGTLGSAPHAPFDGILVAAAAPRVPESLKRQLSARGGRLVVPVGPPDQQWLVVVTREGERFSESSGIGCVFVPLLGAEGWPE